MVVNSLNAKMDAGLSVIAYLKRQIRSLSEMARTDIVVPHVVSGRLIE